MLRHGGTAGFLSDWAAVAEPTKADYAFGALAWLILGPLALIAAGGLIYEAVLALGRFFAG